MYFMSLLRPRWRSGYRCWSITPYRHVVVVSSILESANDISQFHQDEQETVLQGWNISRQFLDKNGENLKMARRYLDETLRDEKNYRVGQSLLTIVSFKKSSTMLYKWISIMFVSINLLVLRRLRLEQNCLWL